MSASPGPAAPGAINDIVEVLEARRLAGVLRGPTASAGDIAQAARALDLNLPESYVAFAKQVGHLTGAGWGVYGIRPGKRFPRSAAGATVLARLADTQFPPHLLVIGQLGDSRFACLDCGDGPLRGAVLDIQIAAADADAPPLAATLAGYVGERLAEALDPGDLGAAERELGLTVPPALAAAWRVPTPAGLAQRVFRPLAGSEPPSLRYARNVLASAAQPAAPHLLPLHLVDARSLACVVCAHPGAERPADFGRVLRWHLDDVPARAQGRLLDIDAGRYVAAIARSEGALPQGKRQLTAAVRAYAAEHGEKSRPRAHVYRPLRLACQNVLVGEAVWAQDARFDGLNVRVWLSSQEPHVNAHEGARALTAMTLAEAFRSGGTMEVRFDEHAEHRVPAALAQWARTAGLDVDDERAALTPAAARELMLAATDMPSELRRRVDELAADGGLSVERACYTLLAGIWRPIELDFLLAASPRALDILRGGTYPLNRPCHQAELDLCRAASMLGTLLARLQQPAQATAHAADDRAVATAVEDERAPISWTMDAECAAVRFSGAAGGLPWLADGAVCEPTFTVLPRALPTAADGELAAQLAGGGGAVAVLTPQDVPPLRGGALNMRHPDRRSALDRTIESKLVASRVGRR